MDYRILMNASKSEDEELYVVSDLNKFNISLFQKPEKQDYTFERRIVYIYLAVLFVSVLDTNIFGFTLFLGLPSLIIGMYLLFKYREANKTIVPMEERKIETYQSFSVVYDSDLNKQNYFTENSIPIIMLVFFKASEDFDIDKLWENDYYITENWQLVDHKRENPYLIKEGKIIICGVDEDLKIVPLLRRDLVPTFSREYWNPIYRFILARHEGLYFSRYYKSKIGSVFGMRYDNLIGTFFSKNPKTVDIDKLKFSLLEDR